MRLLSNRQGTVGKILTDTTLYTRIDKLTTDIGSLLDDVKKDPHKYFKGMVCVFRC
jgi:hypothetical protein